jgi:predicted ATP-dependent protease
MGRRTECREIRRIIFPLFERTILAIKNTSCIHHSEEKKATIERQVEPNRDAIANVSMILMKYKNKSM